MQKNSVYVTDTRDHGVRRHGTLALQSDIIQIPKASSSAENYVFFVQAQGMLDAPSDWLVQRGRVVTAEPPNWPIWAHDLCLKGGLKGGLEGWLKGGLQGGGPKGGA